MISRARVRAHAEGVQCGADGGVAGTPGIRRTQFGISYMTRMGGHARDQGFHVSRVRAGKKRCST